MEVVLPLKTLALIFVFGFYAVFNGVLAIAAGLEAFARPNWWLVAGGVAGIVIGFYAFSQPNATAEALVVVVGIFAIVTGVAELAVAATVGSIFGNRFLFALSGVVALALGVLLIMAPGAGILSVLWLIGFYAIFAGVMNIAMGVSLRDLSNTVKSVESTTTSTQS
jgi:uncharacterized membrane protein HdeD (DUF308 family)